MVGATQSALAAQVVRQLFRVPSHMKGAQWATGTAMGEQVPPPSQNWATRSDVPAGQVTALHTVVAGHHWHPPAPSHRPSWPQVDWAWAPMVQVPVGSALPAGSAVQVPWAPETPQLMQEPQLANPQQKPFVQCPVAHWSSVEQATPAGARGTQLPPTPVQ